jgi:hydroxyacylglutathione hydrolase
MRIFRVKVGRLATNCYIVAADSSNEAIVIDPGDEAEEIVKVIERERLTPVLIVNTHLHPDHMEANKEIAEKFGIQAAIGEPEHKGFSIFKEYFEEYADHELEDFAIKVFLNEGDVVTAGKLELTVLMTPGHSKGGICLYVRLPDGQGEGVLFSGDTLFASTYGRVDVPGGSEEEMQRSLSRLMKLPKDTIVYPGHWKSTTIGQEQHLYV